MWAGDFCTVPPPGLLAVSTGMLWASTGPLLRGPLARWGAQPGAGRHGPAVSCLGEEG